MSEFQQVNKAGVTRDLTPEAVVIWGTDGLPMGSAANPIHTTADSSPDGIITGTITVTDAVVAAPGGAGAFVQGTSTSGSYVQGLVTNGATAWDMQITGLTTGTLYFEGSLDSTDGINGNWINLNAKQSGLNNASIVTSATGNGLYRGNASGMKYLRVRSVGSLTGTPAIVTRVSFGIDALFLSAPLPAGLSAIGRIGSMCVQSFLVPTVTASSAYATGNAVGGLITITNATRSTVLSGLLQSAKVTSASAQASTSFDVFLFSSNPTGTTVTDKTTFSVATADLSKLIGIVHCTDITSAGGSVHQSDNTSKPFTSATTSIYAVIVARGTPTFTATSDVTLSVGIVQD